MKVTFEGTVEELAALGVRLDKMIQAERANSGDEEYVRFIRQGLVIEAIKLRRTRTGETLKDAKDWIEALRARLGDTL